MDLFMLIGMMKGMGTLNRYKKDSSIGIKKLLHQMEKI